MGAALTPLVPGVASAAPISPACLALAGSDYIVFLGQDNFIRGGAVFIAHYSNKWPRWLEEYGLANRKAQ